MSTKNTYEPLKAHGVYLGFYEIGWDGCTNCSKNVYMQLSSQNENKLKFIISIIKLFWEK